jgi:hypothetical protein
MNRTTRDLAWWYWLATVGLLASGLLEWANGIHLAISLCAVQVIHFGWRSGGITTFPVQVRVTYLLLLALGLWTPLQWIHLVQVIGTSARVLVGYCLLARTLSLAPWNRVEPLSVPLVRNTFFLMQSAIAPCGSALPRPLIEG